MTENNHQNHYTVSFEDIDKKDQELIAAAIDILKANFHPVKHQIGCALRTSSGKIYSAVNIESSGYGPCAEAVAIGNAISSGERHITSIVAVKKKDENYPVLSPCGNCRQLIIDYAHDANVILNVQGKALKAKATELLPGPYENSLTALVRSSRSSTS